MHGSLNCRHSYTRILALDLGKFNLSCATIAHAFPPRLAGSPREPSPTTRTIPRTVPEH